MTGCCFGHHQFTIKHALLHSHALSQAYFGLLFSVGMKSLADKNIKQVLDFKYLGSYIASTEHDVNIRLGKAWSALNQMDKIWKSNVSDNLKRNFFRAAVESVLVYGSASWTLAKKCEKRIDGAYTRMLRVALNKSWRDHPTNKELYGNTPKISSTIRQQRMRFAGHCWRSKEELIAAVLLWNPKHGKRSEGRPRKTYIDQLLDDTGCRLEELPNAMEDRVGWKKRVNECKLDLMMIFWFLSVFSLDTSPCIFSCQRWSILIGQY